jgi:hypothetical protein
MDRMSSRIDFCASAIELEKKRGWMAEREFFDREDTQFGELGQGASLPFMISSFDSARGLQADIPITSNMLRTPSFRVTGSNQTQYNRSGEICLIYFANIEILI